MDALSAILIVFFAFIAGLLGSMLGLGGGFIIVPALTLAVGIDIRLAISASLIGIIANSTTASTNYLKKGFTNIRLGLVLETTTAVGAIIGALVGVLIHKEVLTFIFAVLLIVLAVFMYIRPEEDIARENHGDRISKSSFIKISGEFHDATIGKDVKYEARSVGKGMVGSFVSGNLSGILGVGGGAVKVPVMNLWMKVPLKAAIATSTFMVGITAVAGALVYYSFGYVSSVITVLVVIGAFIGANIGSRLAPKIKTGILKRCFVVAVAIISVLMFLKAFNIIPS
jgi:uncharacterized membrane protein YfcA